uniref:Major capsid protein N-terminal domain-containing protein n=1 Tax=viral metagenome TaxID=1070528 RepID=A0A6C0LL20_9ZZZZ
MGGGLLQLVAYGAQDVYLTGNPQITFFKVVYRRHTNFAIEAIQQTFNGTVGYGQTVTCQISRNGDLINRVYLQVELPKITNIPTLTTGARYVNYIGLRLIKSVLIEIGGQQIDKHYSDWLYIWNELSLPRGKRYGYDTMVGADKDITSFNNTTLYIPLEFWFCRNVGLALPLIALQYHEVKIKIDFESKANCLIDLKAATGTVSASEAYTTSTVGDVANITDMSLWVDYIFLDTDERRRFAQLSHEYLIEQLQFTGTETLNGGSTNRVKLNFNHPCKELVWVAKPNNYSRKACWYNYTDTDIVDLTSALVAEVVPAASKTQYITEYASSNYMAGFDFVSGNASATTIGAASPFADAILQLNGNDRFSVRDGAYFSFVQPYQHHTNIPNNPGINVYSFALKPEDHQPSGTLNMSRIDTATLMVTTKTITTSLTGTPALAYDGINIYAVNYNVLRILSGMGGLAYSN